jgi:glycerophosphoryl diester phosphodiesterase
MWSDLASPVVIAHRGDKTHAPENTLSAFRTAADNGADAVEFDVKLTADGHVVVIHDANVDRTTDGSGKVSRLPLVALKELDAGSWYSASFGGERIPTLDEIFETVGKRLYMNVELTNYATPLDGLVGKVAETVRKFGLEKRVLFSSFFARNLIHARKLLPEVPCGLLTWAGWLGWPGRTFGFRRRTYQALHPYLSDVTAGLVARVHAAGKRVNVWTVNSDEDLKRLIGLGVDGIFTDDPGRALQLLGRGT